MEEKEIKELFNQATKIPDSEEKLSVIKRNVSQGIKKRMVKLNLIEVLLNFCAVVFNSFFFLNYGKMDQLPPWFMVLLLSFNFLGFIPCLYLYFKINYSSRDAATYVFMKNTVRYINYYKRYQILYFSIILILVMVPGFLVSEAFSITVKEVEYVGILNFPEPYKLRFIVAICIISIIYGLIGILWVYIWYAIFYRRIKKAMKKKIKILESE